LLFLRIIGVLYVRMYFYKEHVSFTVQFPEISLEPEAITHARFLQRIV